MSIKIFKKIKKRFKKAFAIDPNIDPSKFKYFKIEKNIRSLKSYKSIIFLVNHSQFKKFFPQIRRYKIKVIDIFNFYEL